jgi:hypothetical protein
MVPDGWSISLLNKVADFLDNERVPLKDTDRQKRQGRMPLR